MPAEDVEFVTWRGDSEQGRCPVRLTPTCICSGFARGGSFSCKTNVKKKKEIHKKTFPLKLTLRPCCHLPGSEHRAPCASPGVGMGPSRCGGAPPGHWEAGEAPVLAVLDPVLSCCRLIWEQKPQQPQESQLRSLAVPYSSGLGLAEVFWHLHLGRQGAAPKGCRHLCFLLPDLISSFTPDALLVHHQICIQNVPLPLGTRDDRDMGMAGWALPGGPRVSPGWQGSESGKKQRLQMLWAHSIPRMLPPPHLDVWAAQEPGWIPPGLGVAQHTADV